MAEKKSTIPRIPRRPGDWHWPARNSETRPCPSCGQQIGLGAEVTWYRRMGRWVPGEVRHLGCRNEGLEAA